MDYYSVMPLKNDEIGNVENSFFLKNYWIEFKNYLNWIYYVTSIFKKDLNRKVTGRKFT